LAVGLGFRKTLFVPVDDRRRIAACAILLDFKTVGQQGEPS
jgi:hypothetical protein